MSLEIDPVLVKSSLEMHRLPAVGSLWRRPQRTVGGRMGSQRIEARKEGVFLLLANVGLSDNTASPIGLEHIRTSFSLFKRLFGGIPYTPFSDAPMFIATKASLKNVNACYIRCNGLLAETKSL